MKVIALEESFWYDKLATEGSTVSHVRVKSAVAADWQRKLVDFTEYRLPDMDRNGVDMQVLSLTSPGIQVQPDPDIAVADARTASDFLADIIKEHPRRFAELAAIPLQDPPKAAAELRRAIGLGLCGALVNHHTLGHYLDEPQYAPFWETLQDLDVPLYIHPSAVPADNWKVVQGYPAPWWAMARACGVPWWGAVCSAAAPVLLVVGSTIGGHLQPRLYNAMTGTVSALAALGAADRWVMTLAFAAAGACEIATGLPPRPAASGSRPQD